MKSGSIAALKSAGRAALEAVRRAALGAPLFAALLGAALPVGALASNPASLDIDVDFSGIANISNLTASSGTAPGTVDLSWTEPYRNAGVSPFDYDIRVSSVAQIPNETAFSTSSALSVVTSSLPPTPGTGGGAAGFVIAGLTPGVTYYFAIHERDSGSVSDYWIRSPALHLNATNYALAASGAPSAPTAAALLASSSFSVTGDWTLSTGATDYVLAASPNAALPPAPVAASSTTVASTATVAGLSPNTTYYFSVSACEQGCSAFTFAGSTITAAAPALSLSTTSVSSAAVSLAWNPDGNPAGTSYRVLVSTDGVDYTTALSTASPAATASGLNASTTYYFEVVALNGAGTPASVAGPVQVYTPTGAPAAPAGGSPIAVYQSSATAAWSLSAGATDYVLSASLNAANPPAPIAASSTTASSTGTLTGLGPNTTYYLFVSACAGGCSSYTSIGSTITDAAAAISLSTTSVSSSAVSVAWGADGNPAGTQYKVEISTDGVDFTAFTTTTGLAATSAGLSGNTTYYFEAVAVNGAGIAAAPSNIAKVVTLPGPPAAPAGGAPAAVYTSSATATWALSAGATDYVLAASLNAADPPAPIAASSTTASSTGTLTGLGPNTTYYFFVSACGFGCSSYTSIGSTITDAASPIGLSTTSVSSNSISVAWGADGNPAGTQYKVEISTDGVDFTAFAATTGLAATATGLSGNTTYYFETTALNAAGVASAPSNVVQVVTPAGPPAPPAGATVVATSSSTATEGWTLTTGATDYALAASPSSANPPSPAASTATATGTSGVLSGLAPNATYYLFVAACGDGCSAYAAAGSTITAAAPAVSLSTTAVFFNTVSLAWGADGNPAGTSYRVLVSTDGVGYSASAQTTATVDSVGGLAGGATYYFEVVALNAADSPAAPSAPVRVVTPTVPTVAEVPMEPLGVTVTASSTAVHLAWSPTTRYTAGLSFVSTGTPVAGELEGYAIYRSTQICGPQFVQVSTIGPVASPSYTDATGGVSYYYRLFSYNTVGLSTGVVTVSPLGERYFFTDDCVTVLAVDPQTATGANGLVGATNGLGGDVRISRTRRPQDDGVDILQSAQWYAYLNGVTLLPSYVLPTPGHYTLRVTTQTGSVAPDLQPIDMSSPFGGVVAPISGANSATPIDDLGAFWFNGQDYVKQYGRIDPLGDVVTLDSPNLGIYQVRSQGRTASGPVFDVSNISGRIITPGAPGRNSVWIFTYDPGPNNVVPTGRVYDLRGEHVADLQAGLVPNTLTWDGRMNGRGVTSGVYIYHISGGGKTFSGTIVVAK